MKIKTKADIIKVEVVFCNGQDIQLRDSFADNRIIHYLDSDAEIGTVKVASIDTVNGTEYHKELYEYELHDLLWKHRAFINQSGQLDNL